MANTIFKRLEIAARLSSPSILRKCYRFLMSVVHKPISSEALPEHLVGECRVCASRYTMIEKLPKNGVVAEVGTLRGDFAAEILVRAKPNELHLIDIDLSRVHPHVLGHHSVIPHEELTVNAARRFLDNTFDWIYIDAGHDYSSVKADAESFAPKLKPGGYLVFNDFAHIDPYLGRYGVHRAAVEFCLEHYWPLAFFALERSGLYDVAFKKPECTMGDAGTASDLTLPPGVSLT